MAGVIPTSFRAIAPLITARLAEVAEIPASRIFWVARQRVPHFVGPWDLVLRPRGSVSLDPNTEGGGRHDTRLRRIIDVAVRIQRATDESARDDDFLFAEPSDDDTDLIGYFAAQERVIDALHVFSPTAANGDVLVAEPMRMVNDNDPLREQGMEHIWGDGTLAFEVVYTLNLDTDGE